MFFTQNLWILKINYTYIPNLICTLCAYKVHTRVENTNCPYSWARGSTLIIWPTLQIKIEAAIIRYIMMVWYLRRMFTWFETFEVQYLISRSTRLGNKLVTQLRLTPSLWVEDTDHVRLWATSFFGRLAQTVVLRKCTAHALRLRTNRFAWTDVDRYSSVNGIRQLREQYEF